MASIIGIDSRTFVRNPIKSNGEKGHFESVLGVAIKVKDYEKFAEQYKKCMDLAFSSFKQDKSETDYKYYCTNDLTNLKNHYELLDYFFKEIIKYIEKIHVFYTLFSEKRISSVKVYGRMAKGQKIKLNEPTRDYGKLLSSHLSQCFPAICAWRLTEFLDSHTVEFHLDSYGGHIFEAQELLDKSKFRVIVYPGGDCSNPVISTADLLIDFLDKRLEKQNKFLIFENIRLVLPEFGEKTLVYPIVNKHLPYITPLDKKPVDVISKIRHPVFWLFKGEEIIDSETIRHSKSFRNLQDLAASKYGVVKMFDKSKDIAYFKPGDYGVYLNQRGKEQIESYMKIGKAFNLLKFDYVVSKSNQEKITRFI